MQSYVLHFQKQLQYLLTWYTTQDEDKLLYGTLNSNIQYCASVLNIKQLQYRQLTKTIHQTLPETLQSDNIQC